jgi:hypothetical protein
MLLLLSVAVVVVVVFFWGGGGDTNHEVIKLLCVADGIPAGQVRIRSLNPLLLRAAGKVTTFTVAATASCVVHQFVFWAGGGKRAGDGGARHMRNRVDRHGRRQDKDRTVRRGFSSAQQARQNRPSCHGALVLGHSTGFEKVSGTGQGI